MTDSSASDSILCKARTDRLLQQNIWTGLRTSYLRSFIWQHWKWWLRQINSEVGLFLNVIVFLWICGEYLASIIYFTINSSLKTYLNTLAILRIEPATNVCWKYARMKIFQHVLGLFIYFLGQWCFPLCDAAQVHGQGAHLPQMKPRLSSKPSMSRCKLITFLNTWLPFCVSKGVTTFRINSGSKSLRVTFESFFLLLIISVIIDLTVQAWPCWRGRGCC